jgi:hypothetical protein
MAETLEETCDKNPIFLSEEATGNTLGVSARHLYPKGNRRTIGGVSGESSRDEGR